MTEYTTNWENRSDLIKQLEKELEDNNWENCYKTRTNKEMHSGTFYKNSLVLMFHLNSGVPEGQIQVFHGTQTDGYIRFIGRFLPGTLQHIENMIFY